MQTDIQKLLDTIADLRDSADVNAVFGEPVTVEGRTLISAAKVGYAFGLMGGGVGGAGAAVTPPGDEAAAEASQAAAQDAQGSVGLGGVRARPMAVIEVTPMGTRVEPIVDEQKLSLVGAALIGWSIFWLARALIKIFQRE